MNRLTAMASIALMTTACSNSITDVATFGTLRLAIDASSNIINDPNVDAENIANYDIELLKDGKKILGPIKYSELGEWIIPVASNYVMKAQNTTPHDALTANNGWGRDHFAGESAPFAIEPAVATSVAITCTITNAKLSFAYDTSFTSQYTDYSVEAYETSNTQRKLTFDSTISLDAPVACFGVDDSPEVTYVVSYSYNGKPKSMVRRLPIAAAKWYRITLAAPTAQPLMSPNQTHEAAIITHVVEIDI